MVVQKLRFSSPSLQTAVPDKFKEFTISNL